MVMHLFGREIGGGSVKDSLIEYWALPAIPSLQHDTEPTGVRRGTTDGMGWKERENRERQVHSTRGALKAKECPLIHVKRQNI